MKGFRFTKCILVLGITSVMAATSIKQNLAGAWDISERVANTVDHLRASIAIDISADIGTFSGLRLLVMTVMNVR